jgi:hypothetical protein
MKQKEVLKQKEVSVVCGYQTGTQAVTMEVFGVFMKR